MTIKPAKERGKVDVEFNPQAEPRIADAFLKGWRSVPQVKIKKILGTTDFSELSMEAVEYAVALANEFEASLSLIHVVQPSPSVSGLEGVVLVRSDDEIVRLQKKHLSRTARSLSRKGRKIMPLVRYGKPFREITSEAAKQKTDLVVIGTRGHTGLKRVLLGSTAEWVVRHAPCAVLTVPAETANRLAGKRWTSGIKKIVVPIDFSETSAKALPYAVALARSFRAEVLLVHVTEAFRAPENSSYLPAGRMKTAANRAAEEMLSHVQREAFSENIRSEAIIRSGTPFHEITRAAVRAKADLIILTTHGRTGLKHALLGSTVERVVRHAKCPVMVVRDTNHN